MAKRDDDKHGPQYPKLGASVAKFRSLAQDGLRSMTYDERVAYGEAVERAILSLQRTEAATGLPAITPRPCCASGTYHSDGADIDAAIRSQQRAALSRCPSSDRKRRTPAQWAAMYEEAMQVKLNRKAETAMEAVRS